MVQTLEAEIDVNGNVRLLEHIELTQSRRALLTVLDESPRYSPRKAKLKNREIFESLRAAYADDIDEAEKEFLRLANVKAFKVLDEWK